MQRLVVLAAPREWPAAGDLGSFDVRFVSALTDEHALDEADCVALVYSPDLRVETIAGAIERVRRDNAVALILVGDAREGIDTVLLDHDFDAFIDRAWPASLARACVRMAMRRAQLGRNVVEIQRAVLRHTRDETASLYAMAIRDDLTGLYSRRHFIEELDRQHLRSSRQVRPYSLVFVDLDDLKQVNTSFGHLGGSIALRELGRIITSLLRTSDIAGRLGGDEFAVLLADCDRAGGMRFAERLRRQVEAHSFLLGATGSHITVSLGVAAFPQDGATGSTVVNRADAAMFRAKASGKNATAAAS